MPGCDLLEKLYLCGVNNNRSSTWLKKVSVVICLKNCTFVVSTTTVITLFIQTMRCDLLEKLYLCGVNNNINVLAWYKCVVVICLKNCTFVVSTTTIVINLRHAIMLWFAWKIVPLWCQQQQYPKSEYLYSVVICLKNCTFVVSTTTIHARGVSSKPLWFAWKIVPLWCQQQLMLYNCLIISKLRGCCSLRIWYYKEKSHSWRMGFWFVIILYNRNV